MELVDLRYQKGANLLIDGPGALAEVWIDEGRGLAVQLWRRHMRRLLRGIGWDHAPVAAKAWPGGVTLGLGSPIDATDAACEIIDWAWGETRADLDGGERGDLDRAVERIRRHIARTARPRLAALQELGRRNGLTFLEGDGEVSLGLGTGCRRWPGDTLPEPSAVDLGPLHDVPVALVTGTNGKSTTVRLAAAIVEAAGRAVGQSTSDWVKAAGEVLEEGDWSGPGGGRRALRDPRVQTAVLEIARGGLLRRGLTVPHVDVVCLTNLAEDHLGDYGIADLETLAAAKFLVARALRPAGLLVLNADDPWLQKKAVVHPGAVAWFSLEPDAARLPAWTAAGGRAAWLADGQLMLAAGDGTAEAVVAAADVPIGFGGRARFNLANALAAMLIAHGLGIGPGPMSAALRAFENTPDSNPGRGNFMEFGGITVLVDFAHNAHGIAALMASVSDVPARRTLALCGHAGDRSDEEIREIARATWAAAPDRVIVKELPEKLRGRAPGEVPGLIIAALEAAGAPAEAYERADDELAAVRRALEWAGEGDFLVLLIHTQRERAMELLTGLRDRGWRAGDPLG